MSGVATVSRQVQPYTRWWNAQNQRAISEDGPLLIVVGDSTAVGVGATHPGHGYVGQLVAALDEQALGTAANGGQGRTLDHSSWRVVNLAQSGAKLADGIDRQLPIAQGLPPAALLICCLGSNDVVWGVDTSAMRKRARAMVELVGAVADTSQRAIVCPVAGASSRARLVNRAIRAAAENNDVTVASPWGEPGPGPLERLAEDRFHPNDLGYMLMARALGRSLDLEVNGLRWSRADSEIPR